MGSTRGSGSAGLLAWVIVAGVVAAPIGWMVTDHLESDDDFCNACHLEPGLPLHIDLRRDFDAPRAATLAGLHGSSAVRGREEPFRCIDCHRGVGFVGRARVKLLAAKDAIWWAVGHFEEPTSMHWPLWDEDCAQCHPGFDESPSPDWQPPRFHELPVHNTALGVGCVACHLVHEPGGNAQAHFLHARSVRARCAHCPVRWDCSLTLM